MGESYAGPGVPDVAVRRSHQVRIGFVTQWYDPELDSGTYPAVIARALRDDGHEVQVVTGFPNYPTGRLHDGYRLRPYRHDVMRGVDVHRAPLFPSHDRSPVRRAANYLSFAGAASLTALALLRSMDVVLVYSSPATAACPALALDALVGTPFVLLVQDLWPDSVLDSGFLAPERRARVERALHAYCDLAYRRAARIAVIAPSMARAIERRGIAADRIGWVPNWADEAVFRPEARDEALAAELGLTRARNVMYAGNLGEFQCVDVLLDTAARLRSRSDIGVIVAGRGVLEDRMRERVERDGLDNVTFVGSIGPDRIAAVLALGDLQIVPLADVPLFRMTLPSKLQATMAAGRPVLAALPGDGAQVVRDADCGIVVPPDDPETWTGAITEALDDPTWLRAAGARARAYYDEHFAQTVGVARLVELLQAAAADETQGRRTGRRARRCLGPAEIRGPGAIP